MCNISGLTGRPLLLSRSGWHAIAESNARTWHQWGSVKKSNNVSKPFFFTFSGYSVLGRVFLSVLRNKDTQRSYKTATRSNEILNTLSKHDRSYLNTIIICFSFSVCLWGIAKWFLASHSIGLWDIALILSGFIGYWKLMIECEKFTSNLWSVVRDIL